MFTWLLEIGLFIFGTVAMYHPEPCQSFKKTGILFVLPSKCSIRLLLSNLFGFAIVIDSAHRIVDVGQVSYVYNILPNCMVI